MTAAPTPSLEDRVDALEVTLDRLTEEVQECVELLEEHLKTCRRSGEKTS